MESFAVFRDGFTYLLCPKLLLLLLLYKSCSVYGIEMRHTHTHAEWKLETKQNKKLEEKAFER